MDDMKKQAYRKGAIILLMLAVLSVGEYLIGYYASLWWAPILAIALLKAFLIVRDYMHIGRLFAGSEAQVH
jgi:cytochrome c oxidase subunit IV